MKKFLFSIMLFIGCLFVGLSFNSVKAKALLNVYAVTPSTNSNRKITVGVEGFHSSTTEVRIKQIEYCENDVPEGCERYDLLNEAGTDTDTYYFKVLNTVAYPATGETRMDIEYNVAPTESDGTKSFYIEVSQSYGSTDSYYAFFNYDLSTLEERVVINPKADGQPDNVFPDKDNVQYASVRQISIKVELLEAERTTYTGIVNICEEVGTTSTHCSEYSVDESNIMDYDIKSFGDGIKKINISLLKFDTSAAPLTVQREIYLDTIGPEITIEGGTWIYVRSGNTYKVQNATCKDAIFDKDSCTVENDADVVQLNYRTDKYQFVTYTATDRLGNTRSVSVKIKVEQAVKKANYTPFIIGGAIFLVVLLVLGWILIKNHEKKKKISYI